jgi:hypothetical protein
MTADRLDSAVNRRTVLRATGLAATEITSATDRVRRRLWVTIGSVVFQDAPRR